MNVVSAEFLLLQRALVGRYSLVRELGRGGMGIVFLARDVALERPVAIKLLPPELAANPRFREQFLREARLAAALAHPNIVPVHQVDVSGEVVYFVMGYVDGESLGARVRRLGPLPFEEAQAVVRQAAMGLAHAHARGVIHCDVKPDNILIEADSGRALVTDFGIARAVHDATADGPIAGTPHYLSPERAEGATGDAASDQYALGVTAWFACTARHPHEAPTVAALLTNKTMHPAPSLATVAPDAPGALVQAVDRALARAAAERWPDLEALVVALDRSERLATPAPVRAFVRTALGLGRDVALAGTVAASALGVMFILTQSTGLFNALLAQVVMTPIAVMAGTAALVRIAQVATAAVDVARGGHGHEVIARAVAEEVRALQLETETRPVAARRKDAAYYGVIGTLKTAGAIALAASALPGWVTLPAAAIASLVPALTLAKVREHLRPGPGRWPRWMQGGFGRRIFRLIERFVGRPRHEIAATPTVLALGGAIGEVLRALPPEARGQLAEIGPLVERLEGEAVALRGDPLNTAGNARVAQIERALETLRVELLAVHAGLRTVPDVTLALDHARRLGDRVDGMLDRPLRTQDR